MLFFYIVVDITGHNCWILIKNNQAHPGQCVECGPNINQDGAEVTQGTVGPWRREVAILLYDSFQVKQSLSGCPLQRLSRASSSTFSIMQQLKLKTKVCSESFGYTEFRVNRV